jgi:hypothetical protein
VLDEVSAPIPGDTNRWELGSQQQAGQRCLSISVGEPICLSVELTGWVLGNVLKLLNNFIHYVDIWLFKVVLL